MFRNNHAPKPRKLYWSKQFWNKLDYVIVPATAIMLFMLFTAP